jgi:hypothetical protein
MYIYIYIYLGAYVYIDISPPSLPTKYLNTWKSLHCTILLNLKPVQNIVNNVLYIGGFENKTLFYYYKTLELYYGIN